VSDTVTFPPAGPTVLTRTIPAYVYQQFADDDDIQALNTAFNAVAQAYVTWFATIGLPVYTGAAISGALLDWVANGLYGQPRPTLPSALAIQIGPLNTFAPNVLPPNTIRLVGTPTFYSVGDDIYKRCITWNFFKGDGRTFNVRWLKRRIMRFLFGASGINFNVSQTYQISITFGVGNQVNIRLLNGVAEVLDGAIPNTFAANTRRPNQLDTAFNQFSILPDAAVLAAAIDGGVLQLPFQFVYVVVVENGPNSAYFFNIGGVLHVSAFAGYMTNATGLPPGSVWSNASVVTVVSGITPNPAAPPIYFPPVTPAQLLATGGGNLPLSAGTLGSGQLWNNSGVVNVS
jgi:hypothetical protein